MNRKKSTTISVFIFLGMLATVGHKPVHAYNNNGDSAARGAFFGGLTGTAIGGAAGGWKGAAIGGIAGFGLGGMMGASRARHRDPDYKLNKLYKKQDKLQSRLAETKSERKRTRIQRSLDNVQAEIRGYEQSHPRPYGMKHA